MAMRSLSRLSLFERCFNAGDYGGGFLTSRRFLNANRCVVSRVVRRPPNTFKLTYPTLLVNPDGSTNQIYYQEPRRIIRLPVDYESLSEDDKIKIQLLRIKRETKKSDENDKYSQDFDPTQYIRSFVIMAANDSRHQMEGFLCPICMADLGDVIQLQVHFDEKHAKEDPAFVQNLKDLFGKAKKKIDEKFNNSDIIGGGGSAALTSEKKLLKTIYGKEDPSVNSVTGIHYEIQPRPLETKVKSHFDHFQSIRAKRMDRQAMDTNKLIIRMEKLMKNIPSDPSKRRNHEQNIVPWIPEEAVNRCPECTKSFNIARRKHHCRLCGSIMCKDCSYSVSFELARRIINPATISMFDDERASSSSTPPDEPKKKQIFSLRRSDSKESIISILDSKADSQQFRSCGYCYRTLEKRDKKIEMETSDPPIVVQFYERLRGFMEDGEEMGDRYQKMLKSLNDGEETYTLEEAKLLRLQIMKMAEKIDFISKKILVHGVHENEEEESTIPSTSGIALTLQKRIRQASANFIKETLVGFQDVPSESEYEHLKKMRSELAVQRIEQEKNSARIARLKYEQKQQNEQIKKSFSSMTRSSSFKNGSGNNSTSNNKPQVSGHTSKVMNYEKGFVLSPGSSFVTNGHNDDPMLQQMDIIRGFIQEAKNAHRYDEVQMLEANLKELQTEYQKTFNERKELEDNYNSYRHVFKSTSPSSNVPNSSPGNPFDEEDDNEVLDMEDEYDKSGKNPFS